MSQHSRHLLFYDGHCGLCDHFVQIVLKADKRALFLFAPLQGETAKKFLQTLPKEVQESDSVILLENYRENERKLLLYGRAALRTAWLLGGGWYAIGWLHFLPPKLYDWAYRIVAKNRRRIFPKNECRLPTKAERERFLP